MSGVNPSVGDYNGYNRSFGHQDTPKVARQQITAQYSCNTAHARKVLIANQQGLPSVMPQLSAMEDFALLEDEPVFMIKGTDKVISALNGLDRQFAAYAGDPEFVRICIRDIIQPVGFVLFDGRQTLTNADIAVKVGGTTPQGAPGVRNVPGQSNAVIRAGVAVEYDVPELENPQMFGTRASGVNPKKVTLVARAADAEASAIRLHKLISKIAADPEMYRTAMKSYEAVCNANTKTAFVIMHSYQIAALMAIDQMIKDGILAVGPNGGELKRDAIGQTDSARSEDIVAKIAEALSFTAPNNTVALLPKARFAESLTAEERSKWAQLTQLLRERMFPPPMEQSINADLQKVNAAAEFGFKVDGAMWTSKGRSRETGAILDKTPIGRLLSKSYTHFPAMLATVCVALWDMKRFILGQALDTPNQEGAGIFDLHIMPWGSLASYAT